MKNFIKKPYLTLKLCEPTKHFSVCIFSDGELIHKITNFMQFSKEIGHPDLSEKVFESKGDSCKDSALLAESKEIESAKCTDKNDTDEASNACFQFRVTKYLFKNNESFREKYADYYASLLGTCEHYGIASTSNCNTCYMHPSNNSQCTKA
jgi:hypothetical protein